MPSEPSLAATNAKKTIFVEMAVWISQGSGADILKV